MVSSQNCPPSGENRKLGGRLSQTANAIKSAFALVCKGSSHGALNRDIRWGRPGMQRWLQQASSRGTQTSVERPLYSSPGAGVGPHLRTKGRQSAVKELLPMFVYKTLDAVFCALQMVSKWSPASISSTSSGWWSS